MESVWHGQEYLPVKKNVDLSLIRTDGGTQMRAELSKDVYLEYRDRFLAGDEFPPVDLFHDGSTYWLADGFHRFYGAREAKQKQIAATVHNGTQRDAILFAVAANQKNGLRRSNADKRNAVTTLLNDEEWVLWSDVRIAEQAGVSQPTVSSIRAELIKVISSPAAKTKDEPKVGKDGKKRKPPAAKPPKPQPPKQQEPAVEPGECLKGGDHAFDDEACTKCYLPLKDYLSAKGEPGPKVEGGIAFDPANLEEVTAHKEATFAERVKAQNLELDRFCRRVMEAFETDVPSDPWLDDSRLGIARDQIKSACNTIRNAKAYAKPCPKCNGEGTQTGKPCKTCRGCGYLPKNSYEMAGGK